MLVAISSIVLAGKENTDEKLELAGFVWTGFAAG
jgi:hypothetical protein